MSSNWYRSWEKKVTFQLNDVDFIVYCGQLWFEVKLVANSSNHRHLTISIIWVNIYCYEYDEGGATQKTIQEMKGEIHI